MVRFTNLKSSYLCNAENQCLKRKCNEMNFNHLTMLSLFDTYVASIAHYGCEVWGNHNAPDLEKVHLKFCKSILGVKRSTSNFVVYCELGRLPLIYVRKLRIIKYWLKIMQSENCILKSSVEYMYEVFSTKPNCKNWISNVKSILDEIGLSDIFENVHSLSSKYVICIVKERLTDVYKQNILSDITSSSKCYMYKHLIDHVTLQNYLTKPIFNQYKKFISKLRLSSHCLYIETGRHQKIPIEKRICQTCKEDVEDEFHFMLKCPSYKDLRLKFLKPYYFTRPSVFKLVQLLSSSNTKELCNIGKYLQKAFEKRNNH